MSQLPKNFQNDSKKIDSKHFKSPQNVQKLKNDITAQSAFTYSKLTIETLEQAVKYVQI